MTNVNVDTVDPKRIVFVENLAVEGKSPQEVLDVMYALVETGRWKGEMRPVQVATADGWCGPIPAYVMAEGETHEGLETEISFVWSKTHNTWIPIPETDQ